MNFYLVDVILSCLLHGPLTVMFWRGTWNLQSLYIFPNEPSCMYWTLYATGVSVNIFIYSTQDYQKLYLTSLPVIPYRIFSRLYTLGFGLAIVCHWQGLWLLLDHYTGISLLSVSAVTSTAVVILLLLRGYCNALAPPALVLPDWCAQTHFENTTRFRCHLKKSAPLFLLDTIFTVVVIHGLVIISWRGYWEILDLVLYPDDMLRSAIYCILIGYFLRFLVAVIQSKVVAICQKLEKTHILLMLLFEDYHSGVLHISCVNIWRGLWFIQDLYLFNFDFELSNWASVLTGCLGLIILGTFNSVLVRGCNIDGGSTDGQGVICSIGYFSRIELNITERVDLIPFQRTSAADEKPRMNDGAPLKS